MKGRFIHILLFSAFTLLINFNIKASEEMTADDIINTMTETLNPEESKGKMKMTIMTSTGQERTFEYQTFSKDGGEKSWTGFGWWCCQGSGPYRGIRSLRERRYSS